MKIPLLKPGLISLFLILINLTGMAQADVRYPIIPKPQTVIPRNGNFTLSAKTTIMLPAANPDLKIAADFLVDLVGNAAGYKLPFAQPGSKARKNTISFITDNAITNEEGYKLDITSKRITISARTGKGAFLALQSLRQLMPAEIEAKGTQKTFLIPAVAIEDAPRFAYRGLMLDVGRYYYPVDFIRKYIDLMALYKINTFHMHLTEDAGWRMEIKK